MLGYLTGFDSGIFDEMDRMRRSMDRLFGGQPEINSIRAGTMGAFPAINVGASNNQVDVYVFAAGLDPAGLDISLQQNLLTVAGERKVEMPEEAHVYRKERFSGSFRRAITLPDDVDPDRVSANYRDGVLHISVQRREEVKPRQIEVK